MAEEKKEKEEKKKDESTMESLVKEIEKNMFSVKFYPVAVDSAAKDEALAKLKRIYGEGNETGRQLLLYMLHESISESVEFKMAHNFEYMKARNPHADASQLRINVYKKMFNYNTSLEGVTALLGLLGELEGEDAAKLLTYHYTRFCSMESEANIVMRNVVLEALGKSDSPYALKALLEYAKNSDNEKTVQRIAAALSAWDGKLEGIRVSPNEKKELRKKLKEVITRELRVSHYG